MFFMLALYNFPSHYHILHLPFPLFHAEIAASHTSSSNIERSKNRPQMRLLAIEEICYDRFTQSEMKSRVNRLHLSQAMPCKRQSLKSSFLLSLWNCSLKVGAV